MRHFAGIRALASQALAAARRMCALFFPAFLFPAAALLVPAACAPATSAGPATMEHASLLRIERADSFTRVEVLDAWHPGRTSQVYVLVPGNAPLPGQLPGGTLLRTPLRRAIACSAIHAGLLADLGRLGSVAGICDARYVCREDLRAALAAGSPADAGSSVTPDVERLVALRPDAILVSPFENAGHGTMAAAGAPLVECADYMETSALGRAEWMKFFGLLFGCESRTDSLYNTVCAAYDSLCDVAASAKSRPTLMCDRKEGAMWYVPGGQSYLGRIYADAGAQYLFADRTENGSVPLSFEEVFRTARDADVWFVKYGAAANLTYDALADDFAPYRDFRPWRTRRIYGCNTYAVPYYETVPFRPDLLLRDVVKIMHPELLPGHTLRFYTPL